VLAVAPTGGADSASDRPVVVRQGSVLASAFHPELTGDTRLHELFVRMIGDRQR
jgi:5'-phosphate synthase pdxT subunit